MGWILNYTFDQIPSNIMSITIRGVQIYSESIGCLIDSRIDYVKMERIYTADKHFQKIRISISI